MAITKQLFDRLFGPGATQDSAELERARTKAEDAGVRRTFDILWNAEQYSAKNLPGPCLSPTDVLSVATAISKNGGAS